VNRGPVEGAPGDLSAFEQGARSALNAARYDSFVVRVLSDHGDGLPLRGHITHIASSTTAHFANSQALISFILAHLDVKPESSPTSS
jgi:hypothetical protein